jgi:predicted Zn finger-like uncharacterized protein
MANNRPPLFFCPNCKALYRVIKTEAGPETTDQDVICQECKAPFPAREGRYLFSNILCCERVRVTDGRLRELRNGS